MRNVIESLSYKLWKYGLKVELFYVENKARILKKIKPVKKDKSSVEIPEEIKVEPET